MLRGKPELDEISVVAVALVVVVFVVEFETVEVVADSELFGSSSLAVAEEMEEQEEESPTLERLV